ncbi:CubicO group peptidase (beta-lactamase class C family) [Pelomonas saccharophila]|uniref:CubicO group peptidase (Beta-lactamase class C family) n=1 Tax=Roseateles saccharophilus TaxID=304 RepID=A0ABU1YVT8_ROSSA|nr:serine hydrolase domain-containing protein [Roseateles saccharophilus]MDR7272984.1 CubicO group peptidase (beta-lactamase class C family) [Roseateles saccharophilus]
MLAGAAAAAWPARAEPALPACTPASAGFSAERLRRLDTFLDADTRASARGPGHLGAVVLLAREGCVLHHRAHGHRDLARREAMPVDAIFRIYSMTKPIASVAVLMLMEEGGLTLDDAVARHLPEFAALHLREGGAPRRPLTLRHLLTHTSGIETDGSGPDPQAAADLAELARRVAAVPLAVEPGSRFRYDGINTEVLCRVVEVVSGQPFARFLQQRLFDPLGMADTGFAVAAAKRRRIADITSVSDDGRLVLADARSADDPGAPLRDYDSGAGGLYSTAGDYLRFAQMLLDEGWWRGRRLLSPRTVALMRMNQVAHLDVGNGLGPGEGFGLGVSMLLDPAKRGRLGSEGSFGWPGAATTYFTVDPRERLVALLLMQHVPRGLAADPPRPTTAFHNLVYQALET